MLKYIQDFFDTQKVFKDVTKEKQHIVDIAKQSFNDENVEFKMFERKGTVISYSFANGVSHASISNFDRKIKDWEIQYAVDEILKVNEVDMFVKDNGIIHLIER